jgi:hypothetical protein
VGRFFLGVITVLVVPAVAHSQQASITGRVTVAGTNEPLSDARVMVVNTSLVAPTTADGRYTLRGVPTGTVQVRVLRVGYSEQKKTVTIAAGTAGSLEFTM